MIPGHACKHCGQSLVMCGECNEFWCNDCRGSDHDDLHRYAEREEYERWLDDLQGEFGYGYR